MLASYGRTVTWQANLYTAGAMFMPAFLNDPNEDCGSATPATRSRRTRRDPDRRSRVRMRMTVRQAPADRGLVP